MQKTEDKNSNSTYHSPFRLSWQKKKEKINKIAAHKKRREKGFTLLSSLAPQVGLEPTTLRLTAACSAS